MKRLFPILLIAVLLITGVFTTEYPGADKAYADTEEELYILSGEDSGIREIPLSSLRFANKDMNKVKNKVL